MLVPVAFVRRVAVAIMDIVNVVPVTNSLVPAVGTVLVGSVVCVLLM